MSISEPEMVLRAFRGSLGLLLGALGGPLGDLLGLQIDQKALTRSDVLALWALVGFFLILILASSSFFGVVVSLALEPLRVDVELPR